MLWGGEFGRTPGAEAGARNGRDHNPHGYTMFMAGGGVKGGHSHGRTDDYGYYAIENKVHIHDLHATILHLLGLDHERLNLPEPGPRLPGSPTWPASSSRTYWPETWTQGVRDWSLALAGWSWLVPEARVRGEEMTR